MAEKDGTVEERVVPTRPTKRKKLWAYFEENKEAILADYLALKLLDFLKKWGISTGAWLKLKEQWEVQSKQKVAGANGPKPAKKPKEDVDVSLTEHERYLILIGYQQATREFLRAYKT